MENFKIKVEEFHQKLTKLNECGLLMIKSARKSDVDTGMECYKSIRPLMKDVFDAVLDFFSAYQSVSNLEEAQVLFDTEAKVFNDVMGIYFNSYFEPVIILSEKFSEWLADSTEFSKRWKNLAM